jgi:hypothetical protein
MPRQALSLHQIGRQMNTDCKLRMGTWALLTLVGLVLVIAITSALFFEPGHGGGPVNNGTHAAPDTKSLPEPHQ